MVGYRCSGRIFTVLHDTGVDKSERNGSYGCCAIVRLMHLNIVLADDLINNGNATTRGRHGGAITAKIAARSRIMNSTVRERNYNKSNVQASAVKTT